ncbi:flavin reductase family protein [Nostoc sp. FACHB-133]|uniref:flavin reductase family protein n=1 Tax=Nostoc sp. FACHB-133 TaxID=2692835 RepID=UPI0016840A4D|nr:flavin reductase family protein [Nostoc sp. FACHB-133]MBD2527697.1 flavin reductase family protein [Nostoc sp. FACHB-133]
MDINPNDLSPEYCYKLLTGCVVPRPIAVVSTISTNGIANLAPFSYFNILGHAPMALLFSVTGRKSDRSPKDSLRNVMFPHEGGTGEFVINITVEAYVNAMAKTAAPLPYEESEYSLTNLTPVASQVVRPPRVGESPIAFECKTLQIVPVGSANIVIGEVVHIFVEDELVNDGFNINQDKLQAIGRMAGSIYCRTTDQFQIQDEEFFPVKPDFR